MLQWYEIAIIVISAVSAFCALLAVCITWYDTRLNNCAVIKIDEMKAHYGSNIHENNGDSFGWLNIKITNKGIDLHSLEAILFFRISDEKKEFSIGLQKASTRCSNDVFSKGMQAELVLKGYKLEKDVISFLRKVNDLRKHDVTICFYSQGFLVTKFKLYSFSDKIKRKWNRIIARSCTKFKLNKRLIGKPFYVFPIFNVWSSEFRNFIRYTQPVKDNEKKSGNVKIELVSEHRKYGGEF